VTVYQLIDIEREVRDDGNCVRAIGGGRPAIVCVNAVLVLRYSDAIASKLRLLRTETSYEAGSVRRVSTTSGSPQSIELGRQLIK